MPATTARDPTYTGAPWALAAATRSEAAVTWWSSTSSERTRYSEVRSRSTASLPSTTKTDSSESFRILFAGSLRSR